LEDQVILETTDADAPVTLTRRSEENMQSDQPGLLMRRRLLQLLQDHGETEVFRHPAPPPQERTQRVLPIHPQAPG
jgi:hypothetical protein